MELLLDKIRPFFKEFVKETDNTDLHNKLIELFTQLEVFAKHYTIKENVLFQSLNKHGRTIAVYKLCGHFTMIFAEILNPLLLNYRKEI